MGCITYNDFNGYLVVDSKVSCKMIPLKICRIPLRVINSNKFKNLQSYFQLSYKNIWIQTNRSYLTNVYRCDNKWEARFEDKFIKDVKPTEFYYDLIRKYKAEGKVAAVDADILLNSVDKKKADDFFDEMEETIRLIRKSPETVHTLSSTTHAFVRSMMDTQKYDILLKVLTDPINYGVFLDYYTSNLLMNIFLQEEMFTAAARIASCSMLQEDFGPPLTKSLILLSCFKYIFNDKENQPWIDYHPVFEPEEEVKVVVSYIRNPYFDDHFDLKEPLHIVGKTLAWLSFELEDAVMKLNAEVLGWSLYEKWSFLESSLKAVLQEKQDIDEVVISRVSEQVSNCKDEEWRHKLNSLLTDISKENLVSKQNIIGKVEDNFNNCATKYEKEFIESQEKVYDDWIAKRQEEVAKQLELLEKDKLLKEIQEKKKDLERREDVLFFFENRDKYHLILAEKKKIRAVVLKNRRVLYRKKNKKVKEADYYPPEIVKGSQK